MTFERSIRVTFEHGHADKRSDDYLSVAYWCRSEPHSPFSPSNSAWTVQIPETCNVMPGVLCTPGNDLASFEAHWLGFFQDLQPLVVLGFAKQCLRHPDPS